MSLVNGRSALVYSIMIVEDEYLVRQGISSLVDFKKFDMQVIGEAENGIEAWEKIQAECPDIILTDINMPQMNGIKLKRAKLLLLTTDLKVYEIAEQVGFEDMNYFSQRFKQIVGVTPRQFKKGDSK